MFFSDNLSDTETDALDMIFNDADSKDDADEYCDDFLSEIDSWWRVFEYSREWTKMNIVIYNKICEL